MKNWNYGKTLLVCVILVCIIGGSLLLYRAQQPVERLSEHTGTLLSKEIQRYKVRSGARYHLDLTFKETGKIYGIYLGTKHQAERSGLINRLVIGQQYMFYIDETVGQIWSGHNLGIKMIKKSGQVIYSLNPQKDFIGGMILLIMGLTGILTLLYATKRKGLASDIYKFPVPSSTPTS